MTCTTHGCPNQGQAQFQNFCSVQHLGGYAWRNVPNQVTHNRIYFFDRHNHEQNYEYSNFFPKGVVLNNEHFRTAEHAFQASKFSWDKNPNSPAAIVFRDIQNAKTPREAVQIARANSHLVDRNWHVIGASGYTKKEEVMFQIVKDKFRRHPNLRTKLINSGNIRLVEAAPSDPFWGRGDGTGQNKLGRILMRIRREIQNGTPGY